MLITEELRRLRLMHQASRFIVRTMAQSEVAVEPGSDAAQFVALVRALDEKMQDFENDQRVTERPIHPTPGAVLCFLLSLPLLWLTTHLLWRHMNSAQWERFSLFAEAVNEDRRWR